MTAAVEPASWGAAAVAPSAAVDDAPTRPPDAVVGMVAFLAAELTLFIGLISAHVVLRAPAFLWPPADQPRLPVAATGANTVCLLISALTFALATKKGRAAAVEAARPLLMVTFALGVAFVSLQGLEWARLLSFGLTTRSSVYGALFYTLVGVHAAHVVGALVALGAVTAWPTPTRLLTMKMYWFFVVAVWPVLYLLVYVW